MEFTDLDGDTLKVSADKEAVVLEGWSGGESVVIALDPHTADEIASAIIAMARKAREAQQ